MDALTTLSATPKGWLLNSVLAPHADAFVAYLKLLAAAPKPMTLGGLKAVM